MSFVAILLLGAVASGLLPISLMPDIDIPEITVKIEQEGVSVRELETSIVKPMRQRLMQVAHLEDIKSESKDGLALIRLKFKYGTDVNYSFIDVNEKVDAVMRNMPRDVERPAIIKASATDLPVFYINVHSNKKVQSENETAHFMELSEFVNAVIRKRLEQLPQVAMVDVTGQIWPELYILPNNELLETLNISHSQIQKVLRENNISLGSLQVIDGQYQYNIRFANSLSNVEDVQNLFIKTNNRLLQLKDIADIGMRSRSQKGMFMQDQHTALSLALIKQSDARMADLKEQVSDLLQIFREDYPEISFAVSRDQTAILDYAIDNLLQSLLVGGLLAFLIMFFFMKDMRSPWLIGFSIPVSLIISLLFFHLMDLSLNIISLSGLILGIGMMIDNSIIVIDNITQQRERGATLTMACIKGTNEVIRPLISSVLTTCAVFLPLIFVSGISGALFYDQAVAVAIGLLASLLVSITLLPTLYHLFWLKSKSKQSDSKTKKWLNAIQFFNAEDIYEKGWHWVFKRKRMLFVTFLMFIGLGVLLGISMKKERFPAFEQDELLVKIDWNENIHIKESTQRITNLLSHLEDQVITSNAYIGTQQYVMNNLDLSSNEVLVHLELIADCDEEQLRNDINKVINQSYQKSKLEFSHPETIFERLFADDEAPFVVRISSQLSKGVPDVPESTTIIDQLQAAYPDYRIESFAKESFMQVLVQAEKLALYEVDQERLFTRLKAALNEYQVSVLRSRTLYIPIVISDKERTINTILKELSVKNKNDIEIPVRHLLTIRAKQYCKTITGGKDGEYLAVPFFNVEKEDPHRLAKKIKEGLQSHTSIHTSFSGQLFSARLLFKEMVIVMLIALALLYFILAAQFESLSQPLIVLLEVPIDIAGALGLLWIFGGTINLMAMIGIIVMSGIIINDSILKIDTINQLWRQGMGLLQAIETAGKRRLKPILMTSLTTIFAMVPFLFANDMGSELQKPLALTVIGGMLLGTLVSLYFIPLCYYYLNKNKA
ncbi:efflux RND transporter permease subunit [Marinilabiliaceae bacterium N1Y90]|nr:efflux RND transporter permease subunit [Marinilabiliaceae bacterium N1Y90]